ncbi:MAG: diaminopimelate decarboxylase [Methylococcaceae bacterium NSP1-2]|nr:pyridoxal-dependent decarboxylase, exosortase A system-associated [Methylococcaceae bacterium]OYV18464.1 MAG: diaminopimelate decarboxylase [Methylococcaceae bacterium NSP1-2]
MAGLVDGFDVASSAEMKIALDTAMPVQQISIAGPGKSVAELNIAIAAGVTINVESFNELETIARLSAKSGITASVAIRINPAFELKTSGMKMGGGAKPFGIDEEQLPAVLRHLQVLPVDFQGFHIYSGSQNLKADALIEAQRQSFALALRLLEFCPNGIKKLNIGGGYGIPYFVGESPLNIEQVGDALAIEMAKFKSVLPEAEVIIELGRYLVGEAGIYVCQVVDKKISRGQVYLVVNGGLHHHLAASGNFGQVIRKNYPLAIGNKMYAEQQEIVNVVGCLCTPLDILADKMPLPVAEVGDLVVVYQSGAYGLTASPSGFLSQPSAEEVLV